MSKIRIGIWGLGYAGRGMYIPELAEYPEMYEIIAGCDSSEANLEAAAQALPSMRKYTSGDEMLKDPEVDLVAIATPSFNHAQHALQSLEAGKYAFVEKPIANTYADALKLKAASERHRGKLYFRHNRRFEPQFQQVRKICDSGALGEIHQVKLHRHAYLRMDGWQARIASGGGHVNDWGSHIVDHALIFLGSEVADVWGNLRKIISNGDAEDHFKIILTGKNGRIVDLEASCGVTLGQPEYVIFGDRGTLICKGLDITMKYLKPGSKDEWLLENLQIDPEIWEHPLFIWKYLYHSISDGVPFPITTDHAVEIVRICEEVKKGTAFQGCLA